MTPLADKEQYGEGKIPNVISALQMERLLAPHGPYNRVLRPSDGMEPDSIAFIQCAGSRDKSMGVPYCSRVCCMYAIKQAMLLSGAVPLADITIYYMDIRTFGKGYEQFFQNSQAMGIEFIKGKVATVEPGDNETVTVRYESQEEDGGVKGGPRPGCPLSRHAPGLEPRRINAHVSMGEDEFIDHQPKTAPTLTDMEGVFTAGVAAGPKDIVDTIVEAGSAAMEASKYMISLERMKQGCSMMPYFEYEIGRCRYGGRKQEKTETPKRKSAYMSATAAGTSATMWM